MPVLAVQSSIQLWMVRIDSDTVKHATFGSIRIVSRNTFALQSMRSSYRSGGGSSSSGVVPWPTFGLSWTRTCITRHKGKPSLGASCYLAKPTRCIKMNSMEVGSWELRATWNLPPQPARIVLQTWVYGLGILALYGLAVMVSVGALVKHDQAG